MRGKTAKQAAVILEDEEWGKEKGMDLSWTQQERDIDGNRIWTTAHGLVWSRKPKPERLLAAVYVSDNEYSISTLGLSGLEPDQLQWLEQHLESLGLEKRHKR